MLWTTFLAAGISLTPSTEGEDAQTLLRRVISAYGRQQEIARQYVFRETTVTRELDSDGRVKRTKSEIALVTPGPDGEYRRIEGKDGRPLSAEEDAKEERKFQKYLSEQIRMPASEREKKSREKLERRVKRFQDNIRDAIEVFEFETLDDEIVQGVRLRVFRFSPKPGYQGHSRATKVLARMEGTVWIDPQHEQLAKLEVRFMKDLKFLGGIFGRVSEGTEVSAEGWFAGEAEEGVWLLDEVEVSLNARLYFLKTYRQRIDIDYHDYQRYRVATEERIKLSTPK
jgi:hypothetical protein